METFTVPKGAKVEYIAALGEEYYSYTQQYTTEYSVESLYAPCLWVAIDGVVIFDNRKKHPLNAKLHAGGNI